MPLDKEKQGLELKDYESKLPNKTYALRVGKEVPEGSVNLAYVHTPKVQSDENISLIDTSYTSDNVIPQNQLQSMVVANESGELEYVDLIGNQEVSPRPPSSTFPTDKVNVTRRFKKNEMRTENALFYKFEIDYHYDSRIAMKNDAGEYLTEKYSGQQIELTDENGNLLDDTYKYDIYVKAHAENPRIYSVRVYLHRNTGKEETIKIRYNHIDNVVPNEQVQSVRRSIELYTNKSNRMTVDNQTRQMLEGGKLRIINGVSAYDKVDESIVRSSESEDEVFAVVPKEDGSGYKIIVPQKSETDPRVPRIFSHRVVAKYKGYDGQEVKVSVGHITDWCINPEALLNTEVTDYSGAWKNIGIPAGNAKLNAKEMIELSLPFGTPSIPSDAEFYIEDDRGNLLYNIKTLTDNANVDTQVNEIMSKTVEAKANGLNEKPWKNALQDNTVIKNNPFAHRASIIPERQKTKWDFTWKANGQGYTERTTNYKTNWQVCADVGFKKTINPQTLDLLDKTKWQAMGWEAHVDKWQYTYVPEIGKNVIEYLENADDIMGFYQKKENIGGTLTDLMNKTDYQFSVKVRLTDPVDDDAIGIMFRVRDSQNYYMFAWEKDEISTVNKTYEFDHGEGIVGVTNGCGRIVLDEYGYTAHRFHPTGGATENWRWTNNKTKYMNQMGFGNKHKKIFKATPSTKAPSADEDNWNGSTRYPTDKTSCQFEDITETASYSAKGWEYNKDYKITVVVTGNLYRIYINDNVDSEDLGALVCQASDNTHQRGTYGIFCISQRWTYWYDLKMTEIEMDTICSESKDVVLTDMTEKKLSNYMVQDILKPFIDDKAQSSFGGAPYEVFGYTGKSAGEFTVRIDPRDNFVYGKTNNPAAGGVVRTDWKTDDNGLTVNGTGMVEYHEDGHFTIVTDPIRLPTEQVPSDVKGFSWNAPSITSGENVSIRLIPPSSVEVTATVPPITLVGVPYVLEDDMILKSEGIKHLEYLFDTDGETGFYNKLQIPNDVPKDELLLRIERGRITGLSPNGNATVENPEYRVNYRFQCQKDGFTRMPVDQFQDQVGVNRLRLKSILDNSDNFDSSVKVDVVAWTTFEELEAVPLFAIKVEEERKIEIEKPRVETRHEDTDNWYLRVKKGKFVKRITLPYHDLGSPEKVPEIYVAYPQLYGMVTRPDEIVEVDLEYNIPEYTDQEFHNRPYTLIDKEVPVLLNEYAIQTRYAPLVLQSEDGISFLEVYSIRANQRRVLRVSDVDAAKGIIYLLDRIREQDDIYVRYAYREDWFTYRGFYMDDSKMVPVESEQDINISFDARLTARVSYEPSKIDITSVDAPEEWCPNGTTSGGAGKILLVYSGTHTFTSSQNSHKNFIQLLKNQGASVTELSIYSVSLPVLKNYSFVLFSNMFSAVPAAQVSAIQQYFAEGGSGMVVSEHHGMTEWYASFDKIVSPYGAKTVPAMLVFTDGRFNASHPLTADIANLNFRMDAASSIDLGTSGFTPVAMSSDGRTMAAIKQDGTQRIFLLSDSNFLTDASLADINSTTNGNVMFAKKLADNMTITIEKINATFTTTDSLKEVRLFINKAYDSTGVGAFKKVMTAPEGALDITDLIKEADASSDTGNLTEGQTNNITVEFINSEGATDHEVFSFTMTNCA
jgi:hypothetical protein